MSSRNPTRMANDEIVGEITHLRNGIDTSARRILELSRTMHDRMRHDERQRIVSRSGETGPTSRTGIYITYSNLWSRFASMVQMGLQRTRQADRVLRLLPEEVPPTPQEQETEAQPQQTPVEEAQVVPAPSPFEDFITLYGEEMIRDATADGHRER